jgi:hypothetical protein
MSGQKKLWQESMVIAEINYFGEVGYGTDCMAENLSSGSR